MGKHCRLGEMVNRGYFKRFLFVNNELSFLFVHPNCLLESSLINIMPFILERKKQNQKTKTQNHHSYHTIANQ